MVEKVIAFFKELKHKFSQTVKTINNAGENMLLVATCKSEILGINFEFTAPRTLQQNGVLKRALAAHFGLVRAMMNEAKFPESLREDIYEQSMLIQQQTLTNLNVSDKISPYQAFHMSVPTFIKKI
jgi:hypothetical protein